MNTLLQLLERVKLRTLLALGSLAGILLALVVGAFGLHGMSLLEAEVEKIYERELLTLAHLKEANLNMIYVSRQVRHMLIAQDDATRAEARARMLRAREELMTELSSSRARLSRATDVDRYEQFEKDLAAFLESVEIAVAMIEKERPQPSEAASYITSPEFQRIVTRADNGLHDLARLTQRGSEESRTAARRIAERIQFQAITILAVGVIAALAFGALIGRSIRRPNEQLRRSVEDLAAGRVDVDIPHTAYPNEVGMLARSIHVLQDIYRKSNDSHWVKSNAAELASTLQQIHDYPTLAQKTISFLSPLVGAAHGAIYVNDPQHRVLRLLGTYGLTERKQLGNEFRMGEGLVGQCAMEASPILLTAPGDHIRITSGLGSSPAAMIMVVPLKQRNEVLGVLEVAAMNGFEPRARALLEACADVLALNLEILARNPSARQTLPHATPETTA